MQQAEAILRVETDEVRVTEWRFAPGAANCINGFFITLRIAVKAYDTPPTISEQLADGAPDPVAAAGD